MLNQTAIDLTLVAIADPTRRAILSRLSQGEARVTEIAEPFEMSLNAVSKHLRKLERAGLVRREIRGREHWLTFDGGPLSEPSEWIAYHRDFWQRQLEGLAEFLSKENELNSEKEKS